MTVPNTTQTAPIESSVEVVSDVPQTQETSTESKSEGQSDNVESFESWLAKREAGKTKTEPQQSKSDQELSKTDREVPKSSNFDEKTPQKVPEVAKPTETPTEMSIKVGEREYKANDITELNKSIKDFQTREAETKQNVQSFVDELKSNPSSILEKLELDPKTWDAIATKYYEKFIEPNTLTTEQKLERMQKAEQQRVDTENKTKADKAESDRVAANKQYWSEKIGEALTTEGLPQTEWSINRLAGYIQQARMKGISATPVELAKLVREDITESQKNALQGLNPEQLAAALGEDGVKKFREYQTEKYKQQKFENKSPSKPVEKAKKPGRKYSNPYDLLDDL